MFINQNYVNVSVRVGGGGSGVMSGPMLNYFQKVVLNQVQQGSSFSVIGLQQVRIQITHDFL